MLSFRRSRSSAAPSNGTTITLADPEVVWDYFETSSMSDIFQLLSAFLLDFSLYESRLTTAASRMNPAVSQSYTVADQYCLAGTLGGTRSR